MPDTSVKRGVFVNRLGSPRTRHAVGELPTQYFHVAPSNNLCIWRNQKWETIYSQLTTEEQQEQFILSVIW